MPSRFVLLVVMPVLRFLGADCDRTRSLPRSLSIGGSASGVPSRRGGQFLAPCEPQSLWAAHHRARQEEFGGQLCPPALRGAATPPRVAAQGLDRQTPATPPGTACRRQSPEYEAARLRQTATATLAFISALPADAALPLPTCSNAGHPPVLLRHAPGPGQAFARLPWESRPARTAAWLCSTSRVAVSSVTRP